MIYATSDLHGYALKDFQTLLKKARFRDGDFLFVLGDVIDQNGDGGVETLQWMSLQPNIELLMGNHEYMLLACAFAFRNVNEETVRSLTPEQKKRLKHWMDIGAAPTIASLRTLAQENPEAVNDLLDYVKEAPMYETVETASGDYLLVHSGLGGFSPDKKLKSYTPGELLCHRPKADERYFEDVMTVLGHTPTLYYGAPGRMFETDTWMDIDTGAGREGVPMLLRLNDRCPVYGD